MSNLTDGKNALAAGEFELAERKLLKALDTHPDNGDLWWALTLCKAECKNDGELESKLVAEFSAAARSGAPEPSSPFNDSYCQNALKYEKSDKHRDFVQALNFKLDAIWTDARGKALKPVRMPKKSATGSRKKVDVKSALTYVLSGTALVAGLIMFALSYAFGNRPALIAAVVIIFGAIGVITVALMKKSRGERDNGKGQEKQKVEKPKKEKRANDFNDDFD